jgi:hypothetical protein
VLLSLQPGEYTVMVRYETDEGVRYVRGLRVARGENLVRGARVGDLVVDFAQVGVCDRDAMEQAFDGLGDSGMHSYYDQLQTTDLATILVLPNDAKMFIVRSGCGDGNYRVYLLGASSQLPAGIEIDFH